MESIEEKVERLLNEKFGENTSYYFDLTRLTPSETEHLNYLLQLNDEEINKLLWNGLVFFDEDIEKYNNSTKEGLSEQAKDFLQKRIDAHTNLKNGTWFGCQSYQTERLILRHCSYEESQMLSDKITTSSDYHQFIGTNAGACYFRNIAENIVFSPNYFVIVEKVTNNIIGYCGFYYIAELEFANIEYYLFDEYRHKGYCKEACQKGIELAFGGQLYSLSRSEYEDVLTCKKVQINLIKGSCSSTNVGSNATLRSLGFTYSGCDYMSRHIDNEIVSFNYYYLKKMKTDDLSIFELEFCLTRTAYKKFYNEDGSLWDVMHTEQMACFNRLFCTEEGRQVIIDDIRAIYGAFVKTKRAFINGFDEREFDSDEFEFLRYWIEEVANEYKFD